MKCRDGPNAPSPHSSVYRLTVVLKKIASLFADGRPNEWDAIARERAVERVTNGFELLIIAEDSLTAAADRVFGQKWFLKITDYADRLDAGLDQLD